MATKSRACVIGRLIEELDDPYREKVQALVDSARSADALAVDLFEANLTGSASAIRVHRRNECVCRMRGTK